MVFTLTACFGPPKMQATSDDIKRFSIGNVDVDNMRVNYLYNGENNGYPVIFIHGTPGDAESWADMLLNSPPHFQYISMDRLGFGNSAPKTAITDLKTHAKSVKAIADLYGNKKPILLGHSYGGPVVVQAALDYPDAFAGIIIAAGALDPALEETHFLQKIGDTWPISTWIPRMLRNANHELFALKDELIALQPRLVDLTTPTFIVHGEEDSLVPIENVPYMHKYFPKDVIIGEIIIPDRNHFLQINSVKELNQSVLQLADYLIIGD